MLDILIIGGGINGTGIAADAAGRGLSVMLCEQNDLASATSSASSKLIHGGLRYLEQYEFALVREALTEREILLNKAPHLIRPLAFLMPHNPTLRPTWFIQLGLFLYDHLGNRKRLPKSKLIDLTTSPYGTPLKPSLTKAFMFSDCWVDDARLVVANAQAAKNHNAKILTYTEFLSAERKKTHWQAILRDKLTGETITVATRVLINAAGPWVSEILNDHLQLHAAHQVRLIKGSHIVVPRLYDHDAAYLLQHEDRRVIFMIPFQGYTLIGTTEVPFTGDPTTVSISEEEKIYLCNAVNGYLNQPISPKDIIWSYSGVRPLQNDAANVPAEITRSYALELDIAEDKAPLLSIFGGKITTYRKLAEHALTELKNYFSMGPAWTAEVPLPGGDIEQQDFELFIEQLKTTYSWLPEVLLLRYAHQFGTRIHILLEKASCMIDLGEHFGATLYECEVKYLIAEEWAKTAEDILWRRTKLGLHFTAEEILSLKQRLKSSTQ